VEDFTGGTTHGQRARQQWTVDPPFNAREREPVRDWGTEKSPELHAATMMTAL